MEAIGTMAGGIAHDFNNILAIIIGNAELLQYKLPADSPGKKNLINLTSATGRASELVKQILAFSRQDKPLLNAINIASGIDESMTLIRSTMPSTIHIHSDIQADISDLWINADSTQLQQVLLNLCTNATHAMDGQGSLSLSLKKVDLEVGGLCAPYNKVTGKYAQLSVRDTGRGMSTELIEKIFDPFFTTKAATEGTGMGLAVVQGIIVNHDGIIEVESEEGKGSTFKIYFPLSATVSNTPVEPSKSLPKGNEHILFVDDEELLVKAGGEMLQHLNYQVTTETDSSKALEIFQRAPDRFDLIVTDKTMPALSGLEFATEVRKTRKNIPIIVCSGYFDDAIQEGATADRTTFCGKPLSLEQLALAVRQALDGSKSPNTIEYRVKPLR